MDILILLLVAVRMHLSALPPGTDYECEMVRAAIVNIDAWDLDSAEDALQMLDDYELDTAELQD